MKVMSETTRNTLHTLRVECPLSPWTGRAGACQWCDADLPAAGRRSTWCSDRCRRTWERNHIWTKARAAARRRDRYTCRVCNKHKDATAIEVNHIHPVAAHDGASHGRYPSCAHHQENLEVLCKDCHLQATARQREAGLFPRK